jgi:hypothetical protein
MMDDDIFGSKDEVFHHDSAKMSWEEEKSRKGSWKMEEEENENSPSITVMHTFEDEKSLPKPDDQSTQDRPEINSNECIYESMSMM